MGANEGEFLNFPRPCVCGSGSWLICSSRSSDRLCYAKFLPRDGGGAFTYISWPEANQHTRSDCSQNGGEADSEGHTIGGLCISASVGCCRKRTDVKKKEMKRMRKELV